MDTEKLRFAFKGSPNLGRAVYKASNSRDQSECYLAMDKSEGSAPDRLNIIYDRERNSSCATSQLRVNLGKDFRRIKENDLIYIDFKHGFFEVCWRSGSNNNALLITERCNHRCVMCSQPPQDKDDLDWRDKFEFIADKIPESEESFCITGGEPSIYLDELASPIRKLISRGVKSISILSNGALIKRKNIEKFAELIDPEKILWCIPLYSHKPEIHDFIVGSKGAWFKTIEGMINLHEEGFPIQIRFIPLSQNQRDISEFISFAASSLTFAQQLVFMGLEVTGYAIDNLSSIKPDYKLVFDELQNIEDTLLGMQMKFNIFNMPLCNLPEKLWDYSVKSISDWKNSYEIECQSCDLKDSCGGFFTTSKVKLFELKPISYQKKLN